ncbi:MAG: NYN domain-containing protein [Chloroflexales bacterium]|nr:NYN domain-containing protein [Chloroflexales bacterium]
MAEQIRKDVAVFIDFENVYVSVRDKLDANPNFEIIMDRCNELGRVILARAYADWYRYPRITSALYANNIEPMYVPTYYYDKDAGRTGRPIKNSVDMNLCIDAMRTLFTVPNISTFVLVTGDRDFIPLVNSIRQQGKDVIIIGVGGAASSHLAQSADEFIFYEQLIGKTLPMVAATPSGRRISDVDDFERPVERPPERITPRDRSTARATAITKTPKLAEQPVVFNEELAFELLVKAVLEARNRNMMTAFGSLKVLMKEMSGGDFREQQINDGNGRPLERFKDFIHEAARRGKILISSDGVVNEVFLPGEDPRKLSQFTLAGDASGERNPDELPATAIESDGDDNGGKSRRRRRGDRPERPERNERSHRKSAAFDANQILPPAIIIANSVTASTNDFAAPTPKLSTVVHTNNDVSPLSIPPVLKELTLGDESPESGDDLIPTLPFSSEERQFVRAIVGASERPLSFQQIHDLLRNTRNRGADGVSRTNEELRSLIKLSINSGELQRIGRGNRVSYRIAASAPTNDATVQTSVTPLPSIPTTPPVTMIPTPADLTDDGFTLPASSSKSPRRTKRQDAPTTVVVLPATVLLAPSKAPEAKKPNLRRSPKATPAPLPKALEFTPPIAPVPPSDSTRATPRRRKKPTE